MYQAGVAGIFGVTREGESLVIDPRLPPSWPGCDVTIWLDETRYEISVLRRAPGDGCRADLDGSPLDIPLEGLRVPLDQATHRLTLWG